MSGQAQRKFCEALDITPEMAHAFMRCLTNEKIEFYVAPYEADAQLAHLFLTGKAHAVITEDSDLLAFGVKRCFFKMDKNGYGFEVDLDNLPNVKEHDFSKFDLEMLLTTCILSGCDYLESIKGIGFKKAFKLVSELGTDIQAILRKIRREGKFIVPMDYERNFLKAKLTFKFQVVYCPEKEELVHLNDPETHPLGPMLVNYPDLDFLGEKLDQEIAKQICKGEIDPITRQCYTEILKVNAEKQRMKVYTRAPKNEQQKNLKKPKTTLHSFFKKA